MEETTGMAHFRFKGKAVKKETLKRLWDRIRRELKLDKYPIETIKMPKIAAVILTDKRFRKVMKQLLLSPHIMDTSRIEWGEEVGFPSACTFFADVDQKWIILKCEGFNPLEEDLKHELLHIWEAALKLAGGTLSRHYH